MRKVAISVWLIIFAKGAFAGAPCNSLSLDQYKRSIVEKESTGVLDKRLSKNVTLSQSTANNCYVTITASIQNGNSFDNEYGGINYLFDPNGELVDARPYSGPNIMRCNDFVKKDTSNFVTLLASKKKDNNKLPNDLKYPVRYVHIVKRCTVHLAEVLQDDPQKPSLSRTWFFDQNGNIIEFSALERNPKIYPEDKKFKLQK